MNNKSTLDPLGSLLEQKNKGRTRVKIAVFFVLAIHGIGLLALLLQGCRRDEPAQKSEQASTSNNTTPSLDSGAPVAPESTNPPANNPAIPPGQPAGTETGIATAVAPGGTEYTIAKGDTFSSIGSHFHVTVNAIKEANPGVDATRLQIGKKL